jgi:hypothetical protein
MTGQIVYAVYADNGDGEYPSLEHLASTEEKAEKWVAEHQTMFGFFVQPVTIDEEDDNTGGGRLVHYDGP